MPILRVRLNKLSSDWQVARALLEDEYTSLDKALNKFRTRYEFAAHLLDVHRMWCVRRAIAWPSRCLPVRSGGDAADAARSKIYVSASTQTGIKQEDHDDESSQEKDKDEEQKEKGGVDGWLDDGRHSSLQDQIPDTHQHAADVQSHLERINPGSDLLIKQDVASQELCDLDMESSRSESTSEQRHDEEIPTPHRGSDVQSNFESTNPVSDLLIKQEVVCKENCDLDMESNRNESTSQQRHEEGIPTQRIRSDLQSCLERTNPFSDLLIKQEVVSHENCDVDMDSSRDESTSHQGHAEGIPTQHIESDGKTVMDSNNELSSSTLDYDEHSTEHSSQDLSDADGKTILENISKRLRSTYDSNECSSEGSSPGLCDAGISSNKNVQNQSRSERRNSFQCKSCGKTYFRLSAFHLHLKTHAESKIQRQRTHSREKPKQCSVCEKDLITKTRLADHIRTHSRQKPYQCSVCNKAFTNSGHISSHMRTHTGEKPFECNNCSYRCSRKDSLTLHMRTHTGEKSFECNCCSYRCSQRSNLILHMRTHTGEKPFKCKCCSYRCSQSSNLILHMRTHTGEKPFECNHCSYRCSRKDSLTLHMRTHSGEKPYQCSVCNKAFTTSGHLSGHIRTHTGEKPFECNVCSYRFSDKSNLTVHMRRHTREKPYQCPICSKRFTKKGEVNRHMTTHTGEKS